MKTQEKQAIPALAAYCLAGLLAATAAVPAGKAGHAKTGTAPKTYPQNSKESPLAPTLANNPLQPLPAGGGQDDGRQKQFPSSPPPARGRGKTSMKRASRNQFHKSCASSPAIMELNNRYGDPTSSTQQAAMLEILANQRATKRVSPLSCVVPGQQRDVI